MEIIKQSQNSGQSRFRGFYRLVLVAVFLGAIFFQDVNGGTNDFDAENGVTELPTFSTKGKTYRIKTRDTVVLPCEVINSGKYVLAWKRGIAVLTAGNVKVSPDARLELIDGYNLQIRNLQVQDAGDYVCQIGTLEPKEITHTLEILVPPRIHVVSSNGNVEVKKGSTVTLECKASGNPVPTITWSRKNNLLPSGEQTVEGISITIEQANRHQAGIYLCTAANGVGEPVSQQINLHVLYPPEIEVERSWVHSGEGYEAQLVCIVHGEPAPEVMWYQDSLLLDPTERRSMETRGNKHTLTIRQVQSSDFGNYSCVADNSLGRAKKYMELSGRPSPAEFRSAPFSRSWDSYNLTWGVESYPPLEEVRLLYRKLNMNETYQKPGKWHDVILQPQNGETFTHVMSYNIRGLDHGSVFEAIIQAKNRYGWNEVSDLYQFYTRGAEPEMEDMELIASSDTNLSSLPCRTALAAILAAILVFCLGETH